MKQKSWDDLERPTRVSAEPEFDTYAELCLRSLPLIEFLHTKYIDAIEHSTDHGALLQLSAKRQLVRELEKKAAEAMARRTKEKPA
jgi:hypothetical protein